MAASLTVKDAEPVTFLQSCPVCGRRLHIAAEHDGTEVVCFHCHAMFRARRAGIDVPTAAAGWSSPRSTVRVGDTLVAAASG